MTKKSLFPALCLSAFLILGLISCSTTNLRDMPHVPDGGLDTSENIPVEYLCPSELQWQPLMNDDGAVNGAGDGNGDGADNGVIEGFEIISYELKDLKVRWTCVKVDLSTPNLEIVATLQDARSPATPPLSPPLIHVKDFAKKNNAIIAINATPWENKEIHHNPVGIVKIEGIEYFPPVEKYCALAFTKTPLRARILQFQNKEELQNYDYAFGGFFQVLKNGELISFDKTRRSRTCAGTNGDGSQLYFFVVTSVMTPDDRKGFTFEECGQVMKKLGCTDVMHFDGGHSSCLVINGKDFQKPLLNRKIPIAIGLKK